MEATDEFLTSAEVARLLGVGPTSIKRWADSGLLRCARTAGRHRRFTRDEVARFQRRQQEVHPPDPAQVDEWIRRLERDGDPYEALSALLGERARLGSWWQVGELIGVVLIELGRRWEQGTITVLEEHLASERLARVLARAADAIPVPSGAPKALLSSVTGDEHTLGLQLAELCLRERGWRAQWAGRSVPSTELEAHVRQGECEMLALSAAVVCQDREQLAGLVRSLGRAAEESGVQLVLGGSGAWPEPGGELPSFHRVRNFRELDELLGESHG